MTDEWADFNPQAPKADPWAEFNPQSSKPQNIGAVEGLTKPFTSIPSTYNQMVGESVERMKRGVGQVGSLQPWEMAKGVGNVALGGLGYLTAPINAPIHTIVGEPIERAVEHVPVVGPTAAPLVAGLAEAGAGFALPIRAPRLGRVPELPESPYGITLSRGERAGDDAMRAAENNAIRARREGTQEWAEQREAQIGAARQSLVKGLDPYGQTVAETPTQAGALAQQAIRSEAGRARANVRAAYDEAQSLPGEIHAGVFEGIGQKIKGDLTLGDEPVIVDNTTPQASKMINYLDSEMSRLGIINRADPFGPPNPERIAGVNLAGVDQWRKNLSMMRKDAFASPPTADTRATRRVLDAFDRRVEDAVNSGQFTGDQRAVDAYNNARQLNTEYRRTFTKGTRDPIGRVIEDIVDPRQEFTPTTVIDRIVGAGGVRPTATQIAVARRVQQILGPSSPEWIGVKQGLLQRILSKGEGEGEYGVAQLANRLNHFLNTDMAPVVYTPRDLEALRGYGALLDRLRPPSGTYAPSAPAISRLAERLAGHVGGAIGAAMAHMVLPLPLISTPAGYAVGHVAGSAANKAFNSMRGNLPILADAYEKYARAQARSAARPNNVLARRAAAGAAASFDKALAPFGVDIKGLSGPGTAYGNENQENVPGPEQQRKAGGRVDDQKKTTKAEANYHGGTKNKRCGVCTMFRPPSSCTAVRGQISPHGWCKFFEHVPSRADGGKITTKYDVVSGAVEDTKTGEVEEDRHIPEDDRKHIAAHERAEAKAMARGVPYKRAHEKYGIPAERRSVERAGKDWKEYSERIAGVLSHVEHEHVCRAPRHPHVDPQKAVDA